MVLSSTNRLKIFHYLLALKVTLFLSMLTNTSAISFNFTSFKHDTRDYLAIEGDAFMSNDVMQLTKNEAVGSLAGSVGHGSYALPVPLWDADTGELADFTTHFTFIIQAIDPNGNGDGVAFFLAPFDLSVPVNSSGGFLGLFSNNTAFNTSANRVVAVEFDSFENDWDSSPNHVGIDVNSVKSVKCVEWKSSIKNGSVANAWVSYNASTKNLSVFLTYVDNPVYEGQSSLFHIIDLREILPEQVSVGFSASTGSFIEIHKILSWTFRSSLEIRVKGNKRFLNLRVIMALLGFGFLGLVLGLSWFILWRKRAQKQKRTHSERDYDASIENEFEKGTGPKRFMYKTLSEATRDFNEEGKLGEGGFGGVYKGSLTDQFNTEIAVKRVSRGSKQGKKEYIAEVKIISRLRHRNLVQLLGWCHEQGDLILVYEFLPNGSLDTYLFGKKRPVLKWPVRYKIALGLASALLYLHEEWEQCVVHRDIKSSNVMLDSGFGAKLGDFGLARLVDHGEMGSQTTVLAGTMGYLAPECVTVGMASKETDVYSFGVVALEIACGRRPVNPKAEPSEVRLIDWVWNLYGQGRFIEAIDSKLGTEFDEKQIECLIGVGLWCCHPDPATRPSIRQAIGVLNFDAPLPILSVKLPVAMYYAPPMEMCRFSYTSDLLTGLGNQTQCSIIAGYNTVSAYSSSGSGGSFKALLNTHTR